MTSSLSLELCAGDLVTPLEDSDDTIVAWGIVLCDPYIDKSYCVLKNEEQRHFEMHAVQVYWNTGRKGVEPVIWLTKRA